MNGLLDNTMDINMIHRMKLWCRKSRVQHINTSFNLDDIASIMFIRDNWPSKSHKRFVIIMPVQSDVKSLGFDRDTNWLSVLPIYHISGLSVLLRQLLKGLLCIVDKFNDFDEK